MVTATSPDIIRGERILVLVKTYPTPSTKSIEVTCTAGVDSRGRLIRIFPIPFRLLDDDKQFKKFQEIKADIWKSSDPRPESYKINHDSIEVLGDPLPTVRNWEERWARVEHLKSCCMCCLQREQREHGSPTLGFFKPHQIRKLTLRDASTEWTEAEINKLGQQSLWSQEELLQLEKIPYKFVYHYFCPHNDCSGHHQSCTDWEMSQAYRQWRRRYRTDWESKFRNRFEKEIIEKFDTHFFTGTVHQHPNNWMIVGLWRSPIGPRQRTLFSGLVGADAP